jgi:LacI family transcriptional regulator
MSVISFDGSDTSRFTSPPLTVMKQPADEIVEIALEELLRKISDPESEPSHIVMNCELIERASTAALAR